MSSPPIKRARLPWAHMAPLRHSARTALATAAPVLFAVLLARAAESPEPHLALGALQRLKLALLPAEDAPADPPGSASTGRWTTASAAVSSALSAAAASFAGGRGCQCSRALGPGDTPPIADALTRGWWRERVRRFLPQEAWMRIARCAQPTTRSRPTRPVSSAPRASECGCCCFSVCLGRSVSLECGPCACAERVCLACDPGTAVSVV